MPVVAYVSEDGPFTSSFHRLGRGEKTPVALR